MLTLADIREAMKLVWNAKPRATTYWHHPLCLDKGAWGHSGRDWRCSTPPREDT